MGVKKANAGRVFTTKERVGLRFLVKRAVVAAFAERDRRRNKGSFMHRRRRRLRLKSILRTPKQKERARAASQVRHKKRMEWVRGLLKALGRYLDAERLTSAQQKNEVEDDRTCFDSSNTSPTAG